MSALASVPVSHRVPNDRLRAEVQARLLDGRLRSLTELAALVGTDPESLRRALGMKRYISHRHGGVQVRMAHDTAAAVARAIGVWPMDMGF